MASTPSAGQRSGACHERASLIFGITWLAVISPGADFAMISRNSFLHGRRAGMLAALGIAISCWFHVFYAVFGLTVMERLFPHLLNIVKIAGAAYLVYVGAATALARPSPTSGEDTGDGHSAVQAITAGMLTNGLNPKTAVFVISLYTQIIGPGRCCPISWAAACSFPSRIWCGSRASPPSSPGLRSGQGYWPTSASSTQPSGLFSSCWALRWPCSMLRTHWMGKRTAPLRKMSLLSRPMSQRVGPTGSGIAGFRAQAPLFRLGGTRSIRLPIRHRQAARDGDSGVRNRPARRLHSLKDLRDMADEDAVSSGLYHHRDLAPERRLCRHDARTPGRSVVSSPARAKRFVHGQRPVGKGLADRFCPAARMLTQKTPFAARMS
jgi:threonine/homoserine/homoserine lactone efflux protein